MINLTKLGKILLPVLLICLFPDRAIAKVEDEIEYTVEYEPQSDGKYKVTSVKNKTEKTIEVLFEKNSANPLKVKAEETIYPNKIVDNVYIVTVKGYYPVFKDKATKTVTQNSQNTPVTNTTNNSLSTEVKEPTATTVAEHTIGIDPIPDPPLPVESSPAALDLVNLDSFFGTEAVSAYTEKVGLFAEKLSKSENKQQFLIDNDIKKFLADSESELSAKKNDISKIATEAVAASNISDPSVKDNTLNVIVELLTHRYGQRKEAYEKLKKAVDSISDGSANEQPEEDMIIVYVIIGVIALALVLLTIVVISIKKSKSKTKTKDGGQFVETQQQRDHDPDNPAIIIRKKTNSTLKKQSLDDVINNPEYMLINSSEFAPDSAVRNIYIKNTCIKEVYNLYAEDLRDSNNPKEDGCMVLGRWVYSEDTNTYDISLETVVFPGDDAVFKEYELNFGGKIKLRIAEKQRKLRRETNLQYDLVCWIHSHPGLGVFFSNFDDNVQMQLKHPQHPNFLIAFVVDILTSDQEMGIFTFRKDGSMNSKNDLKKMYSLEELYKWALESDKASFNPEKYHNLLEPAKMQLPTCKGIDLNNSSVIDLTQILIDPATGVVGWAVGTTIESNGGTEYVVSQIVKAAEKPSVGVIGALISDTHMSLPTIQRIITSENMNLSFVMVYSTKQNTLTSIPVVNGEMVTDQHYYGEETLDDLKIWTRRRR